LPSAYCVEQHLHRADQLVEVRRVAQLGDVRHHLRADAVQEAEALVADGHRLRWLHASGLQLAQLGVTARSTLVFKPPHRPLSVVTTMKPAPWRRSSS
jgi:hypothetical protein